MIEFLIFFTGVFLGLTIFAIFGANKDLVATEIDRDFHKRLCEEQREALHEAKEKLAQYEDTGLAPDEIHKLNDFEQSQIATLLKEHFELRKERNYWRNEALKWASELGEQKLERGK